MGGLKHFTHIVVILSWAYCIVYSVVWLEIHSFLLAWVNCALADAYERLILDCINGDRRLFIRNDELETAWRIFTPVLKVCTLCFFPSTMHILRINHFCAFPTALLQEIEQRQVVPELYPYGSRGPVGAHYLAAKYGVRWGDLAADAEDEWVKWHVTSSRVHLESKDSILVTLLFNIHC